MAHQAWHPRRWVSGVVAGGSRHSTLRSPIKYCGDRRPPPRTSDSPGTYVHPREQHASKCLRGCNEVWWWWTLNLKTKCRCLADKCQVSFLFYFIRFMYQSIKLDFLVISRTFVRDRWKEIFYIFVDFKAKSWQHILCRTKYYHWYYCWNNKWKYSEIIFKY